MFACDFFAVTPAMIGPIDYVFDRGSLVAIKFEEREKYVELMKSLLAGRPFRYLLVSYEYDQSVFPGPPRAVPEAEVRKLFGELQD